MTECKRCPYKTLDKIPLLIFKDRFYSSPANSATYDFMAHMLQYHPDDLEFLHKRAQMYVDIPDSQYRMDFKKWLKRCQTGLKTYNKIKEV